jgi:uncharacterized protein (DUF433 family)
MSQPVQKTSYPHITRTLAVRGGQPIIEGTRIPVATLIRSHQLGMDFDELLTQYPGLTPASLHAALAYYFDYKMEIDALIKEAKEPPDGATLLEV